MDDDAPLGGDGQSWETAYTYLQDALATSDGMDLSEIRIAQGVYRPDRDESGAVTPGDRLATFQLQNDLAVRGGYRGAFDRTGQDPNDRHVTIFETVLSGDLLGNDSTAAGEPQCAGFGNVEDNSHHVVTSGGTDRSAELEGCTITAGYADDLFIDLAAGAGVYNVGGSPTLRTCTIRDNCARLGAGVFIFQAGSPLVAECVFRNNHAALQGGGMYCGQCTPNIVDCVFELNTGALSGALHNSLNEGGEIVNCRFTSNVAAVHNVYCCPVFIDCVFQGNLERAMMNTSSRPTLLNCRFVGNLSGAIRSIVRSEPIMINCLFADNNGTAVQNTNDSAPVLINCTIVNNLRGSTTSSGAPIFFNCIVWGNEMEQIDPPATVSFSNVQGGYPGEGNIDTDPLFTPEYRLAAGSPCIDAGDNAAVPPDEFDLDGDGDVTEPTPFDLDGQLRFFDDPNTADTGVGKAPIVDMGVYEFAPGPCPWDLTGDGVVDVADLHQLIQSFGPCEKAACPADFDGDGIVNAHDLVELVHHFGPCV